MEFITDNDIIVTLALGLIITFVIWWFEKRAIDIEDKRKDE